MLLETLVKALLRFDEMLIMFELIMPDVALILAETLISAKFRLLDELISVLLTAPDVAVM